MDWSVLIDHFIPKLSKAWYARNNVTRNVNNDILRLLSLINDIWHNILG